MGLRVLLDFDTVMIQLCFWLCVLFIAVTSWFWPWWRTDFGWTITLKIIGIAWLLSASVLQMELGIRTQTLLWMWFASCGFVFIAVVVPWRAWVIWKRQRYGEVDKENEAPKAGSVAKDERSD